jgi:hypothetical protein
MASGDGLGIALRSGSMGRWKNLVFDRPFAILLSDALTGAMAFAGVIYQP